MRFSTTRAVCAGAAQVAIGRTDMENPRYYNIQWLQALEDARKSSGTPSSVLDGPKDPLPQ